MFHLSKSMGSKITNNTTFGSEILNRKCFVQVVIVDIKKNIYKQSLKCRDNLGFNFVILLNVLTKHHGMFVPSQ